jgi:hypothetical protein
MDNPASWFWMIVIEAYFYKTNVVNEPEKSNKAIATCDIKYQWQELYTLEIFIFSQI